MRGTQRSAQQGSAGRGPGDRALGVPSGVVSLGCRREGAEGCARPPASQGRLGGPPPVLHLPEAFLGVKTSRPRKDSSEQDFGSLLSFKMLWDGRGEDVSRQGHRFCLLGNLNPFSKVKSVGLKQRSLLTHAVSRCWRVYSQ